MLSPTFPRSRSCRTWRTSRSRRCCACVSRIRKASRSPTSARAVDEALAGSRRFAGSAHRRARRGRGRQPRHRPHPRGRGGGGAPPQAARLRAVHRAGDGQPRRRHRRRPGGRARPPRGHRGERRRADPRDHGDGRVRRDPARHPLPVRQERRRGRCRAVHQPGEVAHQLRPADRERPHQADRGRARQAGRGVRTCIASVRAATPRCCRRSPGSRSIIPRSPTASRWSRTATSSWW